MPSETAKPLLKLNPSADRPRPVGRPANAPSPEPFPRERQATAIGPKFARLAAVLARGDSALELRADPAGLAPERLLGRVDKVDSQIT